LKGKVYPPKDPGLKIRVKGQAPLQATLYELERLRCNLCSEVFQAEGPPGVGEKKYDERAAARIGWLRYGSGVPFYRLAGLEEHLGIPLPASTQWEIVEEVAEVIRPAFDEMIRQAAQGEVFCNDDTHMKILALARASPHPGEVQEGSPNASERTGLFTSGIVSTRPNQRIALFFTGRRHAGENLARVLAHRATGVSAPIQVCDALSRNVPKLPEKLQTILGNCNAHARRRFVEVVANFPEECRYVLESFAAVYGYDAQAEERRLSPDERLRFHQEHSRPVMDHLHAWLRTQFEEKKVEPNSGLGTAITYVLRHWDRLILFLRQPGAPLDSNLVERALKKAILHRNYVHQPITRRCARENSDTRMVSGVTSKRTVHNHRVSRKAKRRSLGLNFRRLATGIVILSIARFFIARSASTYMWVVAVLSWPSQSAITVISIPD